MCPAACVSRPQSNIQKDIARREQIFQDFIRCQRRTNGRQQEMCASFVYVPSAVGQVLQRAVRSDGENARYRLHLWASRLWRQDDLGLGSFSSNFAATSAEPVGLAEILRPMNLGRPRARLRGRCNRPTPRRLRSWDVLRRPASSPPL
jgi:hypothetical protein